MRLSPVLPSTSQPAVEEFTRVYGEALKDGSEVIAIHMSSGLSGTYQGGLLARDMIANPRLHVFDSLKASVGMGLMVVEAARMARRGESVPAILQRLRQMQDKIHCVFVVGNLECLIKGGRISKTKGLIADVLDIKPILHMNESGHIVPYDKARGNRAAMKKLLGIMENEAYHLREQTVGICHGACPDIAGYLHDEIKARFACREIITGEIGPVIGSHVGQGTYSVFFER
jgi:DegV family protein with EDD domain